MTTDERVLVLMPTARDGERMRTVLEGAGLTAAVCADAGALCRELGAGAGTALLTEEAVLGSAVQDALRRQPPWSDFPLVVLAREGAADRSLEIREAMNATLIERPVKIRSLLSVVRAALRARRHQYAVRDHLTAREQQAEALRASEDRLQTALVAARMVAWEWTPADRKLHVSETASEVLGLPTGVGLTGFDQGLALLHPDDVERYEAAYRGAIERRSGYHIEYRLVRPSDGRVIWIEERGNTVFDQPGGGVRLFGVAADVTERKRAEVSLERVTAESERRKRLYEAVLDSTPDLAYVWGLDHRFTYANEGLLRMWGKSWDEAIGKNCLELGYEPWHAAMHDREIDQVIATKQSLRGEVPFTGTFGRRIYDYLLVPVLGADGEVEAVAGTTRDVTDRQRMEQELRDQDRKKDDFIALLAHELRNPLAPVRNGLQVIRLSSDPAVRERAQGTMDRQLTHMVRLIDDLLDVSRINRGKMELRRERVALADVVASAVEAARPALDAAGHELSVALPGRPVVLDADLTRLAQVFSNLLTNSAKYTPKGGRVWLAAERRDGSVWVTVRDTGIGIPKDSLSTIFDMFSQVDRSVEKSTGGLGIGLALVKGLVEMHGGTVTAASDGEGRGTTFTVSVPEAEPAIPSGPVAADAPARTPARRILVVDDNRDGAESMSDMLGLLGHDVVTAHDGLEAVERAEAVRPDVILMDVGMPRLNGLDATRRIREHDWGKPIAIVALTGWGQEDDRTRSREAGCDAHLVKPVSVADLQRLLSDVTR